MSIGALGAAVFPLLLVMVSAPKLLRLSSWAWLSIPAIAYFGVSSLNQTWLHHHASEWIDGCFLIAIFFVIRSLTVPWLRERLNLVAWSVQLLIASCLATELCKFGTLLGGAFGITLGIQAIAEILLSDIEDQLEREINSETSDPGLQIQGLAFLFPGHSGLVLLCLFLLGSVPGSLLFMIEDLLLHELYMIHWIYSVAVLVVTAISSISLYLAYTDAFCGRAPEPMPAAWRREPPRVLRFLLLLFLVLGLLPAFFL